MPDGGDSGNCHGTGGKMREKPCRVCSYMCGDAGGYLACGRAVKSLRRVCGLLLYRDDCRDVCHIAETAAGQAEGVRTQEGKRTVCAERGEIPGHAFAAAGLVFCRDLPVWDLPGWEALV